MTATEELRHMLDERGVKWSDVFAAMNRSKFTHFEPKDQMQVDVWERDGEFIIQVTAEMDLNPEQVIAATLGRGTCKARLYKPEYGMSDCTICECGEINDISANYCNRCGRRIEMMFE